MIVRPFKQQDQVGARNCILEGLGEHFGFIDESRNPDLDDIGHTYSPPESFFVVAESEGGVIVGTGCLVPESREEGRVVRMSVALSHRRKGVASQILNQIIAEGVARGMKSLVIATEPDWEDAVGFYRASGFIPYGSDDVDIWMRLTLW
ncbi:MAG: GNAT family N-acetyltransferase [Candidatus Kapaibacterium sp.]